MMDILNYTENESGLEAMSLDFYSWQPDSNLRYYTNPLFVPGDDTLENVLDTVHTLLPTENRVFRIQSHFGGDNPGDPPDPARLIGGRVRRKGHVRYAGLDHRGPAAPSGGTD